MKRIYLDNASTTKVYDHVIKEMIPYFKKEYGNPSSPHILGENAKKAVSQSRSALAKEINAKPQEIIFTSSATESNNLAIQGFAKANPNKKTMIISSIEHPSINETCKYLSTQNYKIIKIPVNDQGLLNLDLLEKEIKLNQNNLLLVSIMHVNNVIGTIQDIEKIGLLTKIYNIPFHTDASQSFGKLKIDVIKFNISCLSASAHKIGGPKGIGILYINERLSFAPIFYGGGQERNLRSGTENVPSIIGMAKALQITKKINKDKIKKLQNNFISNLIKINIKINGSIENRIYNNIHASFEDIESESLVQYLSKKGIYISTGSACESKKESEDHVLKAIKLSDKAIKGSIRISLNEEIKDKDVSIFIKEIRKAIQNLSLS